MLSLNGGDDVQAERVCLWGRFEKEAEEDTSNSSNEGSIEVLIDREPLPEGETLYLTPDVAASMTINITFPTGSGNKKLIVELLQKYDPYYGCSLCGGEWRTHLCHAER